MTSRKRHRSWFRTGRSWTWLARSSSEALHGRGASDAARREPARATSALVATVIVRSRQKMRATCLLSRQNLADIFFPGKWRLGGFGCFAVEGTSASETTKGRGAPVADASRAGARDDSRNLENARGDPRRVRARARARVFPDASASATPFTANQRHGRVPFRQGRPTRGGDSPPRGHLPARRARARPRPRSRRRYGRRRARALREAHVPGDFDVADRRGPPARGSPDERAKSDAAAYFFRERDERSYSNCHSNEHCADAVYGQPTIGHGSPLPYPTVVRGVHAPRCLRDRPPTCTCFGPFTFARPLGVLLRAGSFEGRSERSSTADRRAFASAADRRAVASAVTARRGAVRRPAGWLHVRRLAGRRRPLRLVCVRGRRSELLLRRGVRHRLRRLLRGQEELLRREKGRSAVRGEARADFRGENRGVGETRVDSFARSNSIRRKKTKNKKTTSDAGFSFF